jgi:hypothetical protein
MDIFKSLMGQLVPSGLLGGFLVMSLGALVANIPLWISQYLRISALQELGTGDLEALAQKNLLASVLSVLGGGLMLLVFAARLGLARPMRMIALEGPTSVTGTGDALRLAFGRFGPNLAICLVYGIAVAAGCMCCLLPGLAAAVLLYPATYLVATERDFGGSFSMGVDWLQRHTGALLGTMGILVAIALVFGCCNCGFSGVAMERFGPMTVVYMLPLRLALRRAVRHRHLHVPGERLHRRGPGRDDRLATAAQRRPVLSAQARHRPIARCMVSGMTSTLLTPRTAGLALALLLVAWSPLRSRRGRGATAEPRGAPQHAAREHARPRAPRAHALPRTTARSSRASSRGSHVWGRAPPP